MHDDRRLVEARIRRFVDDRLRPAVVVERRPLAVSAWDVPGEPVPFAVAVAQAFTPASPGDAWGRPWGTTWFRIAGAVPDGWEDDRHVVELSIDLGFAGDRFGGECEGLVYRPDGVIVKGVEPRTDFAPVHGATIDYLVEAAANPRILGPDESFRPTALGDLATAGDVPQYRLGRVDVVRRDTVVAALLADIDVLAGLMHELPLDAPRRHELLRTLERALDVLDPARITRDAPAARAELAPALASPAAASAHRLTAIGHAHIDAAWLWPTRETVRKCARTWSNVLDLMDRDPDFVFAASSAQHFAWVEDAYPELFARVRQRIDEGRFIPVGGMWVECDTNMVGGEAMVRQFSVGGRYFREHLGIEADGVWLPDSFGYSAALPQIARLAGASWFLTQKISWNQTNRMPHHSFRWQGIDGTSIFTHFPPVDRYDSDVSASELAHASAEFHEKGRASMSLLPFGYGDGGGGPTREMLERVRRTSDLEGSPKVTPGTPSAFFSAAAEEYANPPMWSGELYLELHRGTYTSQARTKAGNRRSEHLLREAELWATTATVRSGAPYPAQDLDDCWRAVLLNQFHDILPGSAIAWVHREAEERYADVATRLERLIADALESLAGRGDRDLVANAAPHPQLGVPALAVGPLLSAEPATTAEPAPDHGPGAIRLANGLVSAVIDSRGHLVSFSSQDGRELVPPGERAAVLQRQVDTPSKWDAWDIEPWGRRSAVDLVEVDHIESGSDGERAWVTVRRRTGASGIVEHISLDRGAPALRLEVDVDWQERETLLKLAFPIDVHAQRSSSEIAFGHLERPIPENTSWDAARFEICAQRWIHVGEPGAGIAITNDRVYGHDVSRIDREGGGVATLVRLSLLRAPRFPDPDSDQGHHRFAVELRPGDIADAVEQGYRTNLGLRYIRGATDVAPLVAVSDPAVVVEAVKLADDASGDVIVRLYESLGGRRGTTVTAGFTFSRVTATDLHERDIERSDLVANPDGVTLRLRPFEIVTLRFRRES